MDNMNGLLLLEWCDKEKELMTANESRKSSQKEVVREDGQICILDCDKDVPRRVRRTEGEHLFPGFRMDPGASSTKRLDGAQ